MARRGSQGAWARSRCARRCDADRRGFAAGEPVDRVQVLTGAARLALDMRVVMHEDLKATPRFRLLFGALAAGLADSVGGRDLFQRSSPVASPLAS
jgi:hypothetical protein